MRQAFFAALLACCLTTPSGALPAAAGKAVAESESVQVKDDFAASLIVTTDADWKKKWDNAASALPRFNRAGAVAYGRKVFVLTLFANPQTDLKRNANLRCDFKIIDPIGKVQLSQANLVCHAGRLVSGKFGVHLSEPVIAFSGDPGDTPGLWVVEAKLRDANRAVANRAVELALRTSFELKAGN